MLVACIWEIAFVSRQSIVRMMDGLSFVGVSYAYFWKNCKHLTKIGFRVRATLMAYSRLKRFRREDYVGVHWI